MSNKGFNLLKPQIEPPTVWTKIYEWIVGTARLIVIVVEIVVVIAFGFRVVLDIQGNQLTEQIDDKERILNAFQEAESRYVRVQNKTRAFNFSWTDATIYTDVYVEINGYLPQDATELTVQVDGDLIFITGTAPISQVGVLETAFKNSNTFINTELVQIKADGNSENNNAEFSLRSKIKELDKREIVEVDNSLDFLEQ
ncbi:hypothetical protein KC909_04345 [Candidatus Dojkabacteria bacterium]|uniref:Uncharacterized protein n=1 Tax=Candidatus Dojkabacteria bacterium TaxID=2099670 RepID=A0A955L5U6_9BACT|nr:hypothetical protein [Candidatus Dojkabacteria bacterium]